MDDEQRRGPIIQRRREALGLDRPPPLRLDALDRGALARQRVCHPLAEQAVDAAHDAVARSDEVDDHRLHPGAAGARHGQRGAVIGDHDPAQPAHHVLHQRAEGGVEMTDRGLRERPQHPLRHGARPRAEQQAHGQRDGVGHRWRVMRRHRAARYLIADPGWLWPRCPLSFVYPDGVLA